MGTGFGTGEGAAGAVATLGAGVVGDAGGGGATAGEAVAAGALICAELGALADAGAGADAAGATGLTGGAADALEGDTAAAGGEVGIVGAGLVMRPGGGCGAGVAGDAVDALAGVPDGATLGFCPPVGALWGGCDVTCWLGEGVCDADGSGSFAYFASEACAALISLPPSIFRSLSSFRQISSTGSTALRQRATASGNSVTIRSLRSTAMLTIAVA